MTPRLTKYIPHEPTPKQAAFLWLQCLDAFYGGAAGGGKILANDGVVLTPFGWKCGKDLQIGDLINNPDGSVQKIIQIKSEVHLPLWRVYFSDGTSTAVAEDHLWLSWRGRKTRKIGNERIGGYQSAEVVETKTLKEWLERGYSPQIPVCKPQPFNRTTHEIDRLDPYLLGVLLGDGCITHTQSQINITCDDSDKEHYHEIFGDTEVSYATKNNVRFLGEKNKYIKRKLQLYKLLGTCSTNKFIPEVYKFGSIDSRFALVQGLMDTDGYSSPNKNACYFDSTSEILVDDLMFILRSLGCVVTKTYGEGKYKNADGDYVLCNDVYSLYIKSENPDMLFRMKRKQHGIFGKNNIQKSVTKIEIDGEITGRCISVSNPNGLYITNDFIVTHNSDALLMAALQYVDVPGYNALLLRDTYSNLTKPEGLLDRANEWLSNTDARWEGEAKCWRFPSSATLSFGYLDGPRDHFNYQGAAYQFVGIDEGVNVREHQALYLFSRMRKKTPESYAKDLKVLLKLTKHDIKRHYSLYESIPLRFRVASNPPKLEQIERGSWVKKRYVDSETREKGRIFIPAKIKDNPHLNEEEYINSLKELDHITRAQLQDGDWDIQVKGRMFDRSWFEIIPAKDYNSERIIKSVRYWDLAATEEDPNKDPCYTAGVKMDELDDGTFVVSSVIRKRYSSRKVELLIRQTADIDSLNCFICMEQEPGSGGVNTIDNYRNKILRDFVFYAEKKQGKDSGKIAKARPLCAKAEAGNIKILQGAWNEDFISEIELFPDSKFKDQVDAASGALNFLIGGIEPRARTV